MRASWRSFKPAAPARMHLLLASLMWTTVGAILFSVGLSWSWSADGGYTIVAITAAGALGILKSRMVLRRTAFRTIDRIRRRGDGRCLGGFLSWRSWGLVALMAVGGRLLRHSGLPVAVLGFVYTAVGVALFTTSLTLWHAWRQHISVAPEQDIMKP